LYISNPLKNSGGRSFMAKLFSTHPPTEERIAALKGMDEGLTGGN
jgi:Zn-dependent protease with chaperone function